MSKSARRLGQALGASLAFMLALAVAPSSGVAARTHTYSGHTSQRPGRYGAQRLLNNRVSFQMSATSLLNFTIPWVAGCSDAYHRSPDAPLIDEVQIDSLPLTQGQFSVEGAAYTTSPGPGEIANVSLTLKGVVRGRRASGTLSIDAPILVDGGHVNDLCSTSPVVHWQASSG